MWQTRALVRIWTALVVSACTGYASGQGVSQLDRMPRLRAGPPVNFGTTHESFYSIGVSEFDPTTTAQTYSNIGLAGESALRYSTGGRQGFYATAHLPDGAVVTSLTFHLCDSNISGEHWHAAMTICDAVDGICALAGDVIESTSNIITHCKAYSQDLSALNLVVNNQTQRMIFVAIPGENDETNALAGAVVGYKLQVSPAPPAATFGDVPTSHPFFQFIEALVKSGITAGCGGGNYCPDNPVTRGQMAVFLAKALGLQFP